MQTVDDWKEFHWESMGKTNAHGLLRSSPLYEGGEYGFTARLAGYYCPSITYTPRVGSESWVDSIDLVMQPSQRTQRGKVIDKLGRPVPGVTVSTAFGAVATSDASGFYRFTGLPEGSYAVTISKTGFDFSPASRPVQQLAADRTGLDFTGAPNRDMDTLDLAYGFPNPWMPAKATDQYITFRNLTKGTRVRIFTLAGELVRELYEPEGTQAQWDVARDMASGVYVCVLTNERGQKRTLKVAVLK
jgi:hypothetical protein